jgi:hypothetical protein
MVKSPDTTSADAGVFFFVRSRQGKLVTLLVPLFKRRGLR